LSGHAGAAPFRVLPALDDDNRFFWTSGADGRLRLLRCQSCSTYIHPPLPECPSCSGRDLRAEAVSGRGEIFSFTVNHQPWDGDPEPYVIALVALAEQDGLRLTTNIVGAGVDEIRIGAPVQVQFEQHGEVWLPLFEVVGL
jgi:uncharacterized OB-fold protein